MTDQPIRTQTPHQIAASRFLSGIVLLAVVSGGWFVVQSLNSGRPAEVGDESESASDQPESEITLPVAKIVKASFTTEPSRIRRIEAVRTVTGRLTYDEARHIEVKAPVSGVLIDVHVKPGDAVSEGQLLAVINSQEIGRARADVLRAEANHQVVVKQMQRLENVTTNLRSLFGLLDRNILLNEIQTQFKDKPLGTYRQQIMAAYSQGLLANQLETAARPAAEAGSISMKTLRERENDRHVADAQFRSIRETTAYEIEVRQQQLTGELNDAKRKLMIAQNHLTTLLGFADEEGATVTSESLSRMEVRAPFAGTIESRSYARRERVQQSDSLFVLANTEALYVSADIRENDWAAMAVKPGQTISVIAPAIPNRTFTATVHYIGREVDVESNSLPLVATISNMDGLLRPGMFVRVSIPVSQSDEVVAVRTESVMQHENKKFVFISESDRTFRRVDVQTGLSNEEWVEIKNGLQAGENVISGGAFLLKSELLLAGEE